MEGVKPLFHLLIALKVQAQPAEMTLCNLRLLSWHSSFSGHTAGTDFIICATWMFSAIDPYSLKRQNKKTAALFSVVPRHVTTLNTDLLLLLLLVHVFELHVA